MPLVFICRSDYVHACVHTRQHISATSNISEMHACFLHFKEHWPVKSCDQIQTLHFAHTCCIVFACACGMHACNASCLCARVCVPLQSHRTPCCLASRGRRSQRCKVCRSMLVWGICLYPPQSAALHPPVRAHVHSGAL